MLRSRLTRSRILQICLGLALCGAVALAPATLRGAERQDPPTATPATGTSATGAKSLARRLHRAAERLLHEIEADYAALRARIVALAGRAPGSSGDALDAVRGIVPDGSKVGETGASGAAPKEASAYAPTGDERDGNPLLARLPGINVDITGVREAIAAYRSGDVKAGDAQAARARDPLARTTVEWMALRLQPRATGFDRIRAFLAAHPHWPSADWLRQRAEESLYGDKRDAATILGWFADHAPETAYGRLALARAYIATGRDAQATDLVRGVWRNDVCPGNLEAAVRSEFGDRLRPEDDKVRADRMLYRGLTSIGLRAAKLAGPDELVLAKARIAVIDEEKADKLIDAVPPSLRKDPSFLFARIQLLRHKHKYAAAARLMLAAPRDPAKRLDTGAWWTEQRLLARDLLDKGDAKTALAVAEAGEPTDPRDRIEAAFHIGWIALRFAHEKAVAARAFARLADLARAPVSRARADYWQGRTADALGNKLLARHFFEEASLYPATFYGQVARGRLGLTHIPLSHPTAVATGDERDESVRVVELLDALGEHDAAYHLAIDAARSLADESQVAALAAVAEKARDARLTLAVGKIALRRGFPLDDAAYPVFGIPAYRPLAGSAPREIVYAIARQESAFQTGARSSAGARGLMQMIVPTARTTAHRAGVPFDADRLTSDPAFNAQLGAAHLGELLREEDKSLILTFAAYNAGGPRVKQWIREYGDPRRPGVDPIDWIERIPISETRNYVERVMENVEMYRARFAEAEHGPPAMVPATAAKKGGPAEADSRPAPAAPAGPLSPGTPPG